ncbi:MAG TPA: hypothetical protein VMV46_19665 [Thermoanaerobaculia bacterium]|nr:hypothetical protein [Thermoanaerobaculia bacterium]
MIGLPSCREVARAISADELEAATPVRRLYIRLHLTLCRHCRRYARQLEVIADAARELMAGRPDHPPERVRRLKQALIERIDRPAH